MIKKCYIILAFTLIGIAASSQSNTSDTTIVPTDNSFLIDTTIDYGELFQDFEAFMDSILSPHSYFLATISLGKSFYNFESKTNSSTKAIQKLTYSPTVGYYHKSGLGINATGYIVDDGTKMNLYQSSVSPSFDYLKNKAIATGISYTRFFTKDSLPFYTTPLQNELYGYFTYRKSWIRPTVAVSYGWGSRSDYSEREEQLIDIWLRRRGYTYINTEESISDFSLTTSIRHDFYWLDVLTYKDHIRFTPQLSFTSGTQKFGFNQKSNTYVTKLPNNSSVLYNSDNVYLDDKLKFQPLALTMNFRGEYSIGKFFVQPQFALDYYFPATTDNFSSYFSINVGCMF
ncbi:MAG: hypothetical protein KBF82_06685 [Chitinophagaceae bacterium]|nr:hypothetical protein [Chitinophagaceae bacterium]